MNITFLPPKNIDVKDIRHELKSLDNGYTDIATYPNGFVMSITYIDGHADVKTSKPLIKIDDNTYQIPD